MVARVGAHTIQLRIEFKPWHGAGTISVGFVQPFKCLVGFGELQVNGRQ